MTGKPLIIGGAAGFWGEAGHATGQLLTTPGLSVLVYDYLAEITMSIMARARKKDSTLGYATDFVSDVMRNNLRRIADQGIKVLSNAGGVNPMACADEVRRLISDFGLDLKVAVVLGDDLMDTVGAFTGRVEMFDGSEFPDPSKIASVNVYLGAFPIAAALNAGADIVITGRCADSALALATCIHRFGWATDDHDLLAAGSLVGHLLECGPQSTGGNFTDWELAGDLADIGYPVAEVDADGAFTLTKPPDTSGIVCPASVGEQLVYEIGDPQAYILPDCVCDFSAVTMRQVGTDRVRVQGARGRPPTGTLKVSVTFFDGFRAGQILQFNGRRARRKARDFISMGLERTNRRLQALGAPDFADVSVELFGGTPPDATHEEISVKVAVRHDDARAVGLFLKELVGGALATPPGLHFFTGGGRPRPSPVIRLFSFLVHGDEVSVQVSLDGRDICYVPAEIAALEGQRLERPEIPEDVAQCGPMTVCPLEDLAWARSGDKGNAANIGVIARHPKFLPWIWKALDDDAFEEAFSPRLKGRVERFYMPGIHAINYLMHDALGGGGVASLLSDAQGKSYAQILLSQPVDLPAALLPMSEEGSD